MIWKKRWLKVNEIEIGRKKSKNVNRAIKAPKLGLMKIKFLIPHYAVGEIVLKNLIKISSPTWARLDNNIAERAVRPLAIGRKNWLFVGDEEGGEAATVILSLAQSCRAIGVNSRDYLEDVIRRLMAHKSQKPHELLPDQWLESRQ